MSHSAELGEVREVSLPQGTIRYRERGSGPVLLFVHGVLANGDLWRELVPRLAPDFRCVVPDLPLGSHDLPVNRDADLSGPGLAALVAAFIEAIGLDEVTLVGNDTGGAICQMVIASHPERIARLVLTSCDAYENFPPKGIVIAMLKAAAALPWGLAALAIPMRLTALRHSSPLGYGTLIGGHKDPDLTWSWLRPAIRSGGVRRDFSKVLRTAKPEQTMRAAERFGDFDRPVLLVWAGDDQFFPLADAERLQRDFGDARLEVIPDTRTFLSLDAPEKLSELIAGFVREPVAADV